jgi:Predicted membrane protein
MSDIEKRIKELSEKIESLQYRQYGLNNELQALHNELHDLKVQLQNKKFDTGKEHEPIIVKPVTEPAENILEKSPTPLHKQTPQYKVVPKQKLEDFIGTNLTSKVGILITIIGIFIGAKYAIDKDLISPAMRILSGYLAGAALIIIAVRLKKNYENFSAVLMGGGLAVLYFITYIAYGFYQLFPQAISFLLMVAITVAAVGIALWYNQKIIAVLGQVAAYAIPFLLSDGSGRVLILFSYISIINIGLLILSFKKDWKVLYRTAFFLTWLIYASWQLFKQPELAQASIGLNFLFINFFTFYATFLSYKIVRRELYDLAEIIVLLVNALLFFFLGTNLIDNIYTNPHVLTWFTMANAFIHLVIGVIIYRLELADRSVYQFIIGLGILFITIAIPVELNGSWVTLLWAIEATMLCWIALKNKRSLYLVLTLPMIIIAVLSLLQDWATAYSHYNYSGVEVNPSQPFMNLNFWFSLIVCACFGYMCWLSQKAEIKKDSLLSLFFRSVLPVVFILVLYATFFNEINHAWEIAIKKYSSIESDNRIYFKQLSLMIYSFLYFGLWLRINLKFFKSKSATGVLLLAGFICVFIFLFEGFRIIGDLRENYIEMKERQLDPSMMMLFVRYFCFLSLAALIWNAWNGVKDIEDRRGEGIKIFSSLFNIILLSVICNEFIHWMHLAGYQNQYKLGLSIICGLYALVLIFVGIKNKSRHLRISAIILFGITLLKLFFYDIASLPTVSKTIVLIILGVILLIVSFLYNKYKEIIFGDDEKATT